MEKEDMKLIEETVEFLKRISVTNNDDDRNILSEACEKVKGVHRDFPDKISSHTDIISQDSKSEVIKELNDVCDKLSDLSIKAGIGDYVASLLKNDDDCSSFDDDVDDDSDDVDVDDDSDDVDVDDEETSVYLKKKYILAQDIKQYDQTLEFMSKLSTNADNERVVEYDHDHLSLLMAYYAIQNVRLRADLSLTSDVDVSLSQDLSLMISKFRSQVEFHLTAICSNVLNLTYKRDLSQHLNGFKEACLRLPNCPSQILDSSLEYTEWKRISRRSVMTKTQQKFKSCSVEAEGGCKTPIDVPENHEANDELGDIDCCYCNPNKCMEDEDEKYFPRVIRIGNWDPKYEGQGISLLDPSALCDNSEDTLDLANEGTPNFHLLDELLPSISEGCFKDLLEELDSTNMSEGSPNVHPEDDVIMHE